MCRVLGYVVGTPYVKGTPTRGGGGAGGQILTPPQSKSTTYLVAHFEIDVSVSIYTHVYIYVCIYRYGERV